MGSRQNHGAVPPRSLATEEEPVGAAMRRRLAGFVATLRDNGFAVGLAETGDALSVLASPAVSRPASLKPALRALFCATRSDWQRFDDLFDAWWLGRGMRRIGVSAETAVPGGVSRRPLPRSAASQEPSGAVRSPDQGEGRAADGKPRRDVAARSEALTSADIRHIVDPDEMAQVHELARRLAAAMRARLVRRERARKSGRRLDIRRTIHRSVSHGGTPLDLVWRRRKIKPLQLVILLDASGSMNLYTAFFVRFIHGIVDAFRHAEAFVFHTRLAHVSDSLKERDVARALDRLSLMASGIGGGTRIGESLATFNRWHAARVINSRTAVIIVSDGYDTDSPEQLGNEMRRLRLRCKRIVWLNPLIGWRDYAPEARGMQAALPHVDLFAPAHNLASLAALEPYLSRL